MTQEPVDDVLLGLRNQEARIAADNVILTAAGVVGVKRSNRPGNVVLSVDVEGVLNECLRSVAHRLYGPDGEMEGLAKALRDVEDANDLMWRIECGNGDGLTLEGARGRRDDALRNARERLGFAPNPARKVELSSRAKTVLVERLTKVSADDPRREVSAPATATKAQTVVNAFLSLPVTEQERIMHDLGVPLDSDTAGSHIKAVVAAFSRLREQGRQDELAVALGFPTPISDWTETQEKGIDSIVCHEYPDCNRKHAGGAGGVPVHPPVGARVSGDEALIPHMVTLPLDVQMNQPNWQMVNDWIGEALLPVWTEREQSCGHGDSPLPCNACAVDLATDAALAAFAPTFRKPPVVQMDREALALVVRAACQENVHLNAGLCPDALEGFESRDPECAACCALNTITPLLDTVSTP